MTTTDTMTGTKQPHAAVLLRDDDGGSTGDRALLAELRAEPDVLVIDQRADLRAERRSAADQKPRRKVHRQHPRMPTKETSKDQLRAHPEQ